MKVQVHEVTDITRKIDVTLTADEFKQAWEKACQKVGGSANLKGFRPGKVPREVLKQNYRQEIESEAAKQLVNDSYPHAVEESGVTPVSYPEITIRQLKEGDEFIYEAVVEIRPTIDIKDYTDLKLTKKKTDPTDDEVHQGLKHLQERAAQLSPLLIERPAQSGDVILFDYEATQGGKPLPNGSVKDYSAELGRGALLPDFEKGILGMFSGQTREIDIHYNADWHDKKIAGQKVTYKVALKDIKEKKLPELNDEFAKDLGNFTTLEEVKLKVREQIVIERERHEQNALTAQVVDQLAEKNPCSIPNGMIDVELEAMFRHLTSTLQAQGVSPEQAGIKWEEFAAHSREEARKRVMGSLFLEAISKKENITVTSEEVTQRIKEIALHNQQEFEKLDQYYRSKNLLPAVESGLREEKTLAFVLSKAKIKNET
ncbi:MAG: trigger factor [Deltaproteobacteria bacterium]|nr:trigger factor [Deltaproteobacteria bacterium]